MTTKTEIKSPPLTGKGGAGRGQGRKALAPEERSRVGSIRLTPSEWDKFARIGGADRLRKWLKGVRE